MDVRGHFPPSFCEDEKVSFFVQVVNMELEKRVADMETELKIVKGEIKGLLVDIRDLVNKNENPFFNDQKNGVSRLETKGKGAEAENQLPSDEEKNDKNKESAQEPVRTISQDDVPEENMPRQKTQAKEIQAIEPEISARKIDTFTLVELMRWVDYAIRTVGHSNLEVLLELYSLTGPLSEETKYVIKNIANLSVEEPACEDKVSMKDNITVLSQLSAILDPREFKNAIQSIYEDSGWREDKEGRQDFSLIKCTS
jgi:archaellum component FlaD/FlaE